ncbi:MAG: hypothetical protein RLN75_01315 [Longimicrobiales bacterium]
MTRLKPLLFVVGLSLVSAVSLRLLLGRVTDGMNPAAVPPPRVDSAEMSRRFVGCGHFRFVLDSLGYRSGQWPAEVDPALSSGRSDATFLARDGRIVAVDGAERGPEVGDYVIRRDTVYLTLGAVPGGLRARLGPVGDSLGGRLQRSVVRGDGPAVGRLFVSTPVPPPSGCASG